MTKRIRHLLLTSSLLLLTSSLSAAVDQRWTCETSRVEPVYFTAYHGETLKLDAKLLSNGRPVTNVTVASFLWQTNGMGSAWWQTNATVQAGHVLATFTPAMDPGASSITFFFQVTDLDGSNYRPAGKLYLVKALGDNPTFPDIPPPGGTIDFASLTLVNAPWATLDAVQSAVSTGVNQSLNAVANESNRAERTYAKLSDIPTVPSIAGLATTGEVNAARSAAISAAASSAASLYQPLSAMTDYARLSDIPTVPSIAGLATTGDVQAARSAAISAAASSAASLYQPLSAMTDYPQRHEVPTVTLSNNVITVNGQSALLSGYTVKSDASPLPPYLHELSFDDTYPDDAAWYYERAGGVGHCSVRRVGNLLERNYDWTFDDSAEFVVRVSGNAGRVASIGVASVGTNLSEGVVTSGAWSR